MKEWLKMQFNITLPEDVKFILGRLHNQGYDAYVVGGCVRDSILGRAPKDWDICTNALPNQVVAVFSDTEVIPTGLQHGTVTIVLNHTPYECTTYRIDGEYSDNRHPDNILFTTSLEQDLSRRDFTVNAMAYNHEQGLVDPFGGIADIKLKKIRCVGSAENRFNEDALRILRAIRFAAQLNFSIEDETAQQIHMKHHKLLNISVERINSEFCKIVAAESFHMMLLQYKDIFSLIIPELRSLIGFNQNNPYHDYDVFEHTVHALENCAFADAITKLAVFFHDFGKPHCCQLGEDGFNHFKGHGRASAEMADEIMLKLKFDNDTRHKVCELVHYHDASFEVGNKYVKRWLNKLGVEQYERLLVIRRADIKGQKINYEQSRIDKLEALSEILKDILVNEACFSLKDLAINGNDLIALGYEPGKEIGNTLNRILQKVIDGELPNEKELLVNAVK